MPPAPKTSLTFFFPPSRIIRALETLSDAPFPLYRISNRIRQTDLHFDIVPDPEDPSATITYVTSKLTIERNKGFSADQRPNLELDGEVRIYALILDHVFWGGSSHVGRYLHYVYISISISIIIEAHSPPPSPFPLPLVCRSWSC